jgi:RimJ/RimL family protein N-acetyltransferase
MGSSLSARAIGADRLPEALALLTREARENLLLLDLAARLGEPPPPGEMATELIGAFRGAELVGVAALRPTIAFDARIGAEALEALLPLVETLDVGLVKSEPRCVERLWSHLARRRRHRVEELVFAARESLREEDRPDPFAGDVRGFRRWVRGRIPRARLIESAGQICFVGYADVQRGDGWLLQGIYTWPEARRRGFAASGTSALCDEAFAAGASHVQLAVVDGNDAAQRLYESLGFKPFGRVRTILFT